MPIQTKLKKFHFVDPETGVEIPDATFTIRTSLSHAGRNAYMKVVTAEMPDLTEAMGNPDFKPKVGIAVIDSMERVLLRDGLVGLIGVQDSSGKEITAWEEFLSFDTNYVSQVVHKLQEIATASVKKVDPNPNASAPSAAH